jgi:hypothetical protein
MRLTPQQVTPRIVTALRPTSDNLCKTPSLPGRE